MIVEHNKSIGAMAKIRVYKEIAMKKIYFIFFILFSLYLVILAHFYRRFRLAIK